MLKDPLKIFQKAAQWPAVKEICQTLVDKGHLAWLAGGSVRDALIGVMPKDFDIATSGTPEMVEKLFPKTIAVGKVFGVIRVVTGEGDFEVASFRKDGLYVDGRRPETVTFSSPEEDAMRRDFTVNALFYDIKENKIHDFIGGIDDLKAERLRTVGDPLARFGEDKLRILRAIRFVSQLGFRLDPETLQAVRKMTKDIGKVSGERLFVEMGKLLEGKNAGPALALLSETGLAQVLFDYDQMDVNFFEKLKDANPILKWVFLFEPYKSLPERLKLYAKLKISGVFQKKIEEVLSNSNLLRKFDSLSLSDKKYLAASSTASEAMSYVEARDSIHSSTREFFKINKTLPKALVDSDLLLGYKISPGAEFGKLIKEGFKLQLEGQITNIEEARTWLAGKIK